MIVRVGGKILQPQSQSQPDTQTSFRDLSDSLTEPVFTSDPVNPADAKPSANGETQSYLEAFLQFLNEAII